MTQSYADQCLERAENATQGPWNTIDFANCTYGLGECGNSPSTFEDAQFIAHARQDVPELARRLKKACEKLRELCLADWGYDMEISRLADDLISRRPRSPTGGEVKLKEKLAAEFLDPHFLNSSEGYDLTEEAIYLAGFEKAREMAAMGFKLLSHDSRWQGSKGALAMYDLLMSMGEGEADADVE